MTNINVDDFICPISQDIMKNPYIGPEGINVDFDCIKKCIEINGKSPFTREAVNLNQYNPNRLLKSRIEDFMNTTQYQIYLQTHNTEPFDINSLLKTNINKFNINLKSELIGKINNIANIRISTQHDKLIPVDVVAVIDRSGSMVVNVEGKNESGEQIESGLSIQQIVNHALKMITKSLNENDRLAIIIFDNIIEEIFSLKFMNKQNIDIALDIIQNIEPRNQTAIWNAIKKAYEILDLREDKTRNSSVILLTDGIPNISPARGEIETLSRMLYNNPDKVYPIDSFGFGYSLQKSDKDENHTLLYELSNITKRKFAHICDGTMVGNVFANSLSNLKLRSTNNTHVYVKPLNNSIFNGFYYGNTKYNTRNNKYQEYYSINLGCINNGIPKNLLIDIDTSNCVQSINSIYMEYFIEYENFGDLTKSETYYGYIKDINPSEKTNIESNIFRVNSIIKIFNETVNKKKNINYYPDFSELFNFFNTNSLNDPLSLGIKDTIENQVILALTNNHYFEKWGEYYIDMLISSLQIEEKSNWKDSAFSNYRTDRFDEITDKAIDIFDNMPAPISQVSTQNNYTSPNYRGFNIHTQPSTPANFSMSTYNSQENPCFSGLCKIKMADNSLKFVKDLNKNDFVFTPNGASKLICKLETLCKNGYANLVTLNNGLKVTDYHPIFDIMSNKWVFPVHIKESKRELCESVFSLILENNHIVEINNTLVICLGHNFQEGILKHDYFGSDLVINDLKLMPGWKNGHIINKSGCIVSEKGVVKKIIFNGY